MTNKAEKQENEMQHLKRIRALLEHTNAPVTLFKEIVGLASEICRSQFALINLINQKKQWLIASIGLKSNIRIERDIAFFSHAILQ